MKLSALAIILPIAKLAFACGCNHNGDAGRWEDSLSPRDRIVALCAAGGGCHDATQGRMCVNGDQGQCGWYAKAYFYLSQKQKQH
jgi:hypothetical protein